MKTPTFEENLQQLYDRWFYKFATEEPDGTYTLVIHEVHDGDAYTEFEKLIMQLINQNYVPVSEVKKAFRNGQLDCQKAGDPRNHAHFKEAVVEARIDEWQKLLGDVDYHLFYPVDTQNDFINVPSFFINKRLIELQTLLGKETKDLNERT